eukprot:1815745-Ditylum_brightwellii.AAC.1
MSSSPEMPRGSPSKKQSSSIPISAEEKNVVVEPLWEEALKRKLNGEEELLWEKMFDELNTFKEQNGHCN